MFKTYETELAGRKLTLETGKLAGLANGSVLVRYGDTVVLVDVTASKEPRDGIDFFPLSVDYEEKLYAVGKIPGSYTKREGKPSDKAILTSRAIDRPLRPLFPKDFRNDVCVVATVLSVEQDNQPEICAMIGASAALSISDIERAQDAPIMLQTSGELSCSTDKTVATTHTSFLKSFGNNGLNGLSIALDVKIALSAGFPSLFRKLPGIFPTAYNFSS